MKSLHIGRDFGENGHLRSQCHSATNMAAYLLPLSDNHLLLTDLLHAQLANVGSYKLGDSVGGLCVGY